METKFGAKGTIQDGIFFTEDKLGASQVLKHIQVEISRQNSNLGDVKSAMANEAKACGANSIMNFKYGQQAHKGMKLLAFKWDSESWYGEGDAVAM